MYYCNVNDNGRCCNGRDVMLIGEDSDMMHRCCTLAATSSRRILSAFKKKDISWLLCLVLFLIVAHLFYSTHWHISLFVYWGHFFSSVPTPPNHSAVCVWCRRVERIKIFFVLFELVYYLSTFRCLWAVEVVFLIFLWALSRAALIRSSVGFSLKTLLLAEVEMVIWGPSPLIALLQSVTAEEAVDVLVLSFASTVGKWLAVACEQCLGLHCCSQLSAVLNHRKLNPA